MEEDGKEARRKNMVIVEDASRRKVRGMPKGRQFEVKIEGG